MNQYQQTSININEHQPTPAKVNQHQPASNNLNQPHQPQPTTTNQHQPTPTTTNQHQQTPTNANQHQPTHQPASTKNNKHQPASTNINHHETNQPTSIPMLPERSVLFVIPCAEAAVGCVLGYEHLVHPNYTDINRTTAEWLEGLYVHPYNGPTARPSFDRSAYEKSRCIHHEHSQNPSVVLHAFAMQA